MITKFLTLTILLNLNYFSLVISNTLTLKPLNNEGEELAIILLHGALLSNQNYLPLANQLQKTIDTKKLWISLPSAFLQIPFKIAAYKAINDALGDLKKNGFPKEGKIYLAGHSLGGFSVAEYAYEKDNRFAGIILLAATLKRSDRKKDKTTKVLTIGGELDGVMRITRIAEEYYNNCYSKVKKTGLISNLPVVVIKGHNHIQFANGDHTKFIAKNDLRAEISIEESHLRIAEIIKDFVSNNTTSILTHLQDTLTLIKPIISAYEMEGSIHFNRPDQTNCVRGFCGKGSEWIKTAQYIISDMDKLEKEGFILNVENSFVELDSLPPFKDFHHPSLSVDPNKYPKQFNISTFSQNSWNFLDKYYDGGLDYTSSNEIGSKLISRQCSYIQGANRTKEEAPFSLDTDELCSDVNKQAYNWALNITNNSTLQRYLKYGQKYVFKKDIVKSNGFMFTYFLLQFKENKDSQEIEVISPALMTSIDAPPVPIFAPEGSSCYHYCKFLSPARVIEWIYVDSLRKNYGLLN
jgi:hypothetical protein